MCGRFSVVEQGDLGLVLDAVEAGSWDGLLERLAGRAEGGPVGRREARPTMRVQVVARGGGLATVPMAWGFSISWQRGVVFNARIERAGDPRGMWAEAFSSRRCVVPAWSFFEPHRSETARSPRTGRTVKRQYAFAAPDGAPLLLAGVYDRPLDERDFDASPAALAPGDGASDDVALALGVPVPGNAACAPDATGPAAPLEPPRFAIVTTAPAADVAAVHDRMPVVLSPAEAARWLAGDDPASFADASGIRLDVEPEAPPAASGPGTGAAAPGLKRKPAAPEDGQLSFGF